MHSCSTISEVDILNSFKLVRIRFELNFISLWGVYHQYTPCITSYVISISIEIWGGKYVCNTTGVDPSAKNCKFLFLLINDTPRFNPHEIYSWTYVPLLHTTHPLV